MHIEHVIFEIVCSLRKENAFTLLQIKNIYDHGP